jgi:dihydroorotate dehydrogenase (NAD+) catalytic subunit
MITLSNGFQFEYVTASGALGYDGKGWPWEWPLRWLGLIDPSLFANVIKTLTLPPRKGNLRWWKPWMCVRPMLGGAVNAVGLTNPGPDWWAEKIGPKVDSKKIPLVGSIYGEQIAGLTIMAKIMDSFDLVAIELNASCPNTTDGLLYNADMVVRSAEAVKRTSRHPLWVKLSVAHKASTIVSRLNGIAEALSINSVPWRIIFPTRTSPMEKYGGGGVSGKIAQPITWSFAQELQSIADIPVIAPSVWDFGDIAELRAKGFKAFSFGSVFLCHPWRPTLYVRREQKSNPA